MISSGLLNLKFLIYLNIIIYVFVYLTYVSYLMMLGLGIIRLIQHGILILLSLGITNCREWRRNLCSEVPANILIKQTKKNQENPISDGLRMETYSRECQQTRPRLSIFHLAYCLSGHFTKHLWKMTISPLYPSAASLWLSVCKEQCE
jgi:hypothetical protein